MLPARAEPAGLQPRAGTTALAGRVTEDDIWMRLTTPGMDVLYGLSFDQAAAGAPLLIEAVALQHSTTRALLSDGNSTARKAAR
jgi:hypothetical protein